MDHFDQDPFEKKLQKVHTNRRILLAVIAVAALTLFLVTYYLYEATKVVEEIVLFGSITRQEVTYNNAYTPFIAAGFSIFLTAIFVIIFDCVYCRIRSFQKYGQWVTLERRPMSCLVYLDGKECVRIGPFDIHAVATVWFHNKVTATISFTKAIWFLAYITFSDHSTSIEI
jgi:hypothetical protein